MDMFAFWFGQPPNLLLLVILVMVWAWFRRVQRDPNNNIDFSDVFRDDKTGKISLGKFLMLGGWAVVSWAVMSLVSLKIIAWEILFVYVLMCAAPSSLTKIADAWASRGFPPQRPPEPPSTTINVAGAPGTIEGKQQ